MIVFVLLPWEDTHVEKGLVATKCHISISRNTCGYFKCHKYCCAKYFFLYADDQFFTSFLGLKHQMKEKQVKSTYHFLIILGATSSSTASGGGSDTDDDSGIDESRDKSKSEKEDQSTIIYILIASLAGIILLIIILISIHRYQSMLS